MSEKYTLDSVLHGCNTMRRTFFYNAHHGDRMDQWLASQRKEFTEKFTQEVLDEINEVKWKNTWEIFRYEKDALIHIISLIMGHESKGGIYSEGYWNQEAKLEQIIYPLVIRNKIYSTLVNQKGWLFAGGGKGNINPWSGGKPV